MNQIELQQKIAEYFQKLPSDLQTLFSSMKWLEITNAICKKYNLNNAQTETLITETTLALLCVISVEEYEDTLRKEIEVSEEIMDKILTEIDFSIIANIVDELAETYNKNIDSILEKVEDSDWSQNVDFVLSGGDYSSFLKEKQSIEKPQLALENFNLEITDGKNRQ